MDRETEFSERLWRISHLASLVKGGDPPGTIDAALRAIRNAADGNLDWPDENVEETLDTLDRVGSWNAPPLAHVEVI